MPLVRTVSRIAILVVGAAVACSPNGSTKRKPGTSASEDAGTSPSTTTGSGGSGGRPVTGTGGAVGGSGGVGGSGSVGAGGSGGGTPRDAAAPDTAASRDSATVARDAGSDRSSDSSRDGGGSDARDAASFDGRGAAGFSELYTSIFGVAASCWGADCHNPGMKDTIFLATKADAYRTLRAKAGIVIPGNPSGSALVRRLETSDVTRRMPLNKPPLSRDLILKVRSWIAAGALDN